MPLAQVHMWPLENMPVSKATVLIEQRSSIPEAQVSVLGRRKSPKIKKVTPDMVIAAVTVRYRNFFGWAVNIFLGNDSENRSIQEYLDKGHPEMAGNKVRDHIARIKRAWALDSSFEPKE